MPLEKEEDRKKIIPVRTLIIYLLDRCIPALGVFAKKRRGSHKVRLGLAAEDSLETSSLISSRNNEKIFMNVVCCSHDRCFKV